ncbi:MAG: hypothetical protein BWZ08_01399 [candidate division BRC1 bacterium ADurb.BinA292]|nr:MAG: hypothetical protein BWZ08_01399 [candidate division BRC1 bacterium ADurb.BinA292]
MHRPLDRAIAPAIRHHAEEEDAQDVGDQRNGDGRGEQDCAARRRQVAQVGEQQAEKDQRDQRAQTGAGVAHGDGGVAQQDRRPVVDRRDAEQPDHLERERPGQHLHRKADFFNDRQRQRHHERQDEGGEGQPLEDRPAEQEAAEAPDDENHRERGGRKDRQPAENEQHQQAGEHDEQARAGRGEGAGRQLEAIAPDDVERHQRDDEAMGVVGLGGDPAVNHPGDRDAERQHEQRGKRRDGGPAGRADALERVLPGRGESHAKRGIPGGALGETRREGAARRRSCILLR